MVNGWSEHWIAGGIICSLVWFLAGKQSAAGPRPENAIFWYAGGVLVLVAMCGWAVADGEWLGFASGVLILLFEIWWAKRAPKA